jgi:hypothetical protein
MRFQSDPNLKPTEIQPPTVERRAPVVLARTPDAGARLRRTLRKGGTVAVKGSMLILLLLKHSCLPVKPSLLEKRIALAIALLITFCSGVVAVLGWQSSRQARSVPQAAPQPVALSPTLERQLEAMSSGVAAVQRSVDELSSGLGQMRRGISDLQTTEQALFDKVSEPPLRPAAAPPAKSTPRPSQAPTQHR